MAILTKLATIYYDSSVELSDFNIKLTGISSDVTNVIPITGDGGGAARHYDFTFVLEDLDVGSGNVSLRISATKPEGEAGIPASTTTGDSLIKFQFQYESDPGLVDWPGWSGTDVCLENETAWTVYMDKDGDVIPNSEVVYADTWNDDPLSYGALETSCKKVVIRGGHDAVLDVNYDSPVPIDGFQFRIEMSGTTDSMIPYNLDIVDTFGGAAEAAGFIVDPPDSEGVVVGSMDGADGAMIPAGSGVLTKLLINRNLDHHDDDHCLSDLTFTAEGDTPLDASLSDDCRSIVLQVPAAEEDDAGGDTDGDAGGDAGDAGGGSDDLVDHIITINYSSSVPIGGFTYAINFGPGECVDGGDPDNWCQRNSSLAGGFVWTSGGTFAADYSGMTIANEGAAHSAGFGSAIDGSWVGVGDFKPAFLSGMWEAPPWEGSNTPIPAGTGVLCKVIIPGVDPAIDYCPIDILIYGDDVGGDGVPVLLSHYVADGDCYTIVVEGGAAAGGDEADTDGDAGGDGIVDTPGCMDETACNYNADATVDDGSCYWPESGYDCEGIPLSDVGDSSGGGTDTGTPFDYTCNVTIGHLITLINQILGGAYTNPVLPRTNIAGTSGVNIAIVETGTPGEYNVTYDSTEDIYGVAMHWTGLDLDGASIASAVSISIPSWQLNTNSATNKVIAYSLTEAYLPAGSGDIFKITVDPPEDMPGTYGADLGNFNVEVIGSVAHGYNDSAGIPGDPNDSGGTNVADVVIFVGHILDCPSSSPSSSPGGSEITAGDSGPETSSLPAATIGTIDWAVEPGLNDGSIISLENYSCKKGESFVVNSHAVNTINRIESWLPLIRENKDETGETVTYFDYAVDRENFEGSINDIAYLHATWGQRFDGYLSDVNWASLVRTAQDRSLITSDGGDVTVTDGYKEFIQEYTTGDKAIDPSGTYCGDEASWVELIRSTPVVIDGEPGFEYSVKLHIRKDKNGFISSATAANSKIAFRMINATFDSPSFATGTPAPDGEEMDWMFNAGEIWNESGATDNDTYGSMAAYHNDTASLVSNSEGTIWEGIDAWQLFWDNSAWILADPTYVTIDWGDPDPEPSYSGAEEDAYTYSSSFIVNTVTQGYTGMMEGVGLSGDHGRDFFTQVVLVDNNNNHWSEINGTYAKDGGEVMSFAWPIIVPVEVKLSIDGDLDGTVDVESNNDITIDDWDPINELRIIPTLIGFWGYPDEDPNTISNKVTVRKETPWGFPLTNTNMGLTVSNNENEVLIDTSIGLWGSMENGVTVSQENGEWVLTFSGTLQGDTLTISVGHSASSGTLQGGDPNWPSNGDELYDNAASAAAASITISFMEPMMAMAEVNVSMIPDGAAEGEYAIGHYVSHELYNHFLVDAEKALGYGQRGFGGSYSGLSSWPDGSSDGQGGTTIENAVLHAVFDGDPSITIPFNHSLASTGDIAITTAAYNSSMVQPSAMLLNSVDSGEVDGVFSGAYGSDLASAASDSVEVEWQDSTTEEWSSGGRIARFSYSAMTMAGAVIDPSSPEAFASILKNHTATQGAYAVTQVATLETTTVGAYMDGDDYLESSGTTTSIPIYAERRLTGLWASNSPDSSYTWPDGETAGDPMGIKWDLDPEANVITVTSPDPTDTLTSHGSIVAIMDEEGFGSGLTYVINTHNDTSTDSDFDIAINLWANYDGEEYNSNYPGNMSATDGYYWSSADNPNTETLSAVITGGVQYITSIGDTSVTYSQGEVPTISTTPGEAFELSINPAAPYGTVINIEFSNSTTKPTNTNDALEPHEDITYGISIKIEEADCVDDELWGDYQDDILLVGMSSGGVYVDGTLGGGITIPICSCDNVADVDGDTSMGPDGSVRFGPLRLVTSANLTGIGLFQENIQAGIRAGSAALSITNVVLPDSAQVSNDCWDFKQGGDWGVNPDIYLGGGEGYYPGGNILGLDGDGMPAQPTPDDAVLWITTDGAGESYLNVRNFQGIPGEVITFNVTPELKFCDDSSADWAAPSFTVTIEVLDCEESTCDCSGLSSNDYFIITKENFEAIEADIQSGGHCKVDHEQVLSRGMIEPQTDEVITKYFERNGYSSDPLVYGSNINGYPVEGLTDGERLYDKDGATYYILCGIRTGFNNNDCKLVGLFLTQYQWLSEQGLQPLNNAPDVPHGTALKLGAGWDAIQWGGDVANPNYVLDNLGSDQNALWKDMKDNPGRYNICCPPTDTWAPSLGNGNSFVVVPNPTTSVETSVEPWFVGTPEMWAEWTTHAGGLDGVDVSNQAHFDAWSGGSDRDLKTILGYISAADATSDYHLIGLSTFSFEWNEVADALFGLSGTVDEGFIAEQLETLYPAPDPENPPTSREDGHIWWHEYMSDEQKSLHENVHEFYTFFNSELLEAEIAAAKEAE